MANVIELIFGEPRRRTAAAELIRCLQRHPGQDPREALRLLQSTRGSVADGVARLSPWCCHSRLVRGVIAFLVTCVAVLPCHAGDPWTGSWDTRWRGGGARPGVKRAGGPGAGAHPLIRGPSPARTTGPTPQRRWDER